MGSSAGSGEVWAPYLNVTLHLTDGATIPTSIYDWTPVERSVAHDHCSIPTPDS